MLYEGAGVFEAREFMEIFEGFLRQVSHYRSWGDVAASSQVNKLLTINESFRSACACIGGVCNEFLVSTCTDKFGMQPRKFRTEKRIQRT